MIKKSVLNHSGMSLVSVLMAAAMTAGIALVIAQLGKNSSTINQDTVMNNDINALYNRIEKYMLHSDSCRATIKQFPTILPGDTVDFDSSQSIKTSFLKAEGDPSIEEDYVENPQISLLDEFGKPTKIGRVTLHKMQIKRIGSTNELELLIYIDKDNRPPDPITKKLNERIIIKKVSLQAKFDDTLPNKPVSCYSQLDNAVVSGAEQACKSVDPGATFDFKTVECKHTQEYYDNILDSISPGKKKPIYIDPDTGNVSINPITHTVDKTCSVCKKSGCNPPPCPAGYSRSPRTCSKGKSCGFKPKHRNCRVTCSKPISSTGFIINN